MPLKICSFSSGSRGNCCLISSDRANILIDAGISLSRLKNSLAALDLKLSDIDGVVITHEHSDHICGLSMLSRYVKVYAHDKSAKALKERGVEIENLAAVPAFDVGFEIGDIFVVPFRLPHDAAYTLGYSFYHNGKKISVATDMGHVTTGMVNNLLGSNIIMVEANHDVDMLKNGSYTEALKRRILSDNGHLSNDNTARLACAVLSDKLERIILAHLSQENNLAELAYGAVASGIDKTGVKTGRDVLLEVACQHVQTPCFEVKR